MSRNKDKLTPGGQARRGFLGSAALATAATAAAGLVGSRRAIAASNVTATCPTIPTPMHDVEGKVAFITGGDSGIGLGIARAFTDAGMKAKLADTGGEVLPGTSADFAKLMAAETEKWGKVVKAANIKAD